MIPRALESVGTLGLLVTDVWCQGPSARVLATRRLRQRFHSDLLAARAAAWNFGALFFEMSVRKAGWERILARNRWFQQKALGALRAFRQAHRKTPVALFCYSYTAKRLFEFAKDAGWTTVLGQIDPGLQEEKLLVALGDSSWHPAPPEYWNDWRLECELSDHILVNSEWCRRALRNEGVPGEKLRLVPLAYEPPPDAESFRRTYPDEFTPERPLRILFLGQINIRKGAGILFDVMTRMAGEPVHFQMVGPLQLPIPDHLAHTSHVHWIGALPRDQVATEYRRADIFLFPTLSDGFGLTQLEAQAWKLPVIASQHCGEVISHMRNGYLLRDLTADSIISALTMYMRSPQLLASASANSGVAPQFTKRAIANHLTALV